MNRANGTKNPRLLCVLSGGAGTRLWPLSRESFPKQFYDLTHSGKPLIVNTLERLRSYGSLSVITTEALKFSTLGILKQYHIEATVLGEPQAKNTAPAVALATFAALKQGPNTLVGIFPADHFISNLGNFGKAIQKAFEAAEGGKLVTLGIQPLHPATGYGYIELKEKIQRPNEEVLNVNRFIEKPNKEKAEELISSGKVVWNAGIFVFQAGLMAEEFKLHSPELWKAIQKLNPDLSNLKEIYAECPKESFDYAIMEKAQGIMCIPTSMGWSDVGAWEEVAQKSQALGSPIEVKSQNNFYTGLIPDGKRVAFVGVSDLMVVDTPDALLVGKKGFGQDVKDVVERLKKESPGLTKAHTFEERPWGRFEVIKDTKNFKSKLITVWPGQKLSYQSHKHRAEHWVVVKGKAEVTLDEKVHSLYPGDHIFIPTQAKHRMANPGTEPMEFIEVQTGTYFGEDDIIRYSDDYGRK